MKLIDRILRDWRVRKVVPYINKNDSVLDIGCYDETMYHNIKGKISSYLGIDPLINNKADDKYTLIKGEFPKDIPEGFKFNNIIMLAVLEHIPSNVQLSFSKSCYDLLNQDGLICITVPNPMVDKILDILKFFRLISGMSLEEHYGFKISDVNKIFDSSKFILVKHDKFQLGLNNLFVFKKK